MQVAAMQQKLEQAEQELGAAKEAHEGDIQEIREMKVRKAEEREVFVDDKEGELGCTVLLWFCYTFATHATRVIGGDE